MTSITIGGNSNETKLVLASSQAGINTSESSHAAPDKLVNYMIKNGIVSSKYLIGGDVGLIDPVMEAKLMKLASGSESSYFSLFIKQPFPTQTYDSTPFSRVIEMGNTIKVDGKRIVEWNDPNYGVMDKIYRGTQVMRYGGNCPLLSYIWMAFHNLGDHTNPASARLKHAFPLYGTHKLEFTQSPEWFTACKELQNVFEMEYQISGRRLDSLSNLWDGHLYETFSEDDLSLRHPSQMVIDEAPKVWGGQRDISLSHFQVGMETALVAFDALDRTQEGLRHIAALETLPVSAKPKFGDWFKLLHEIHMTYFCKACGYTQQEFEDTLQAAYTNTGITYPADSFGSVRMAFRFYVHQGCRDLGCAMFGLPAPEDFTNPLSGVYGYGSYFPLVIDHNLNPI